MLILDESEKFDIKGMLQKNTISYDIKMIMEVNKNPSTSDMETYNPKTFTTEDIEKIVSSYPLSEKIGMGVMFITEALNKSAEEAVFHLVALNMGTKQVLVHERFSEVPQGFGVGNFWAGAIYKIVKGMKKKGYKTMKAKY
ncbi:MAG: hypothetical protein OEW67_02770 [Cyclobacteriaceae bacterium]|nr:hypothetical protein [Cyclobacteriaceae bacterium]